MNTQSNNTGIWQESLYLLLAITGLIGAWAQALGYISGGFLEGNLAFWKDALTTPASIFLVVDIFVLSAALFVWMFAECRRLGISHGWAWAYLFGSAFIAISCAFPLFLAHRQRVLRTQQPEQNVSAQGTDLIGVAIAVLLAAATVYYSFMHLPA